MKDLEDIRKEINEIDENMRELFVRRLALAKPLPKLEMPGISLPNPLKKSGGEEKTEGARLHLLPKWKSSEDSAIPARRMRAIRARVRAGYERALSESDGQALAALNDRFCREITEQIEQRLRELSEQVEIPL